MSTGAAYGVGIDLGGTQIKAVAVDAAGMILSERTTDNGGTDPVSWIARIAELLADWAAARHEVPSFVGLCAPGLAAADAGSIAFMPGRMVDLEMGLWGGVERG